MIHLNFILVTAISIAACGQAEPPVNPSSTPVSRQVEPLAGSTIQTRFPVPSGFERVPAAEHTFAFYLRSLPLKPVESPVHLFDGNKKGRQDVHAAVVDMEVGNRDLQQCADAVMRLRAEYLFAEKRYDEIKFNFTNGFPATYKRWRQGQRIMVYGNRCEWRNTGNPSTTYRDFREYLDQVFMYAGTLSLSKELKQVALKNLDIGDVFIQGGSPGHAVIVVDVAVHKASGNKIFMLAQSYMPAQEIHILKNFQDDALSPWYSIDFGETLYTPEWEFPRSNLKGF